MKKRTLAAVLASTMLIATGSYVALAKPGGGFRGGEMMFDRFDANQDGTITQEEVEQAKADQFATMDADGDGELTQIEIEEGRQKLKEERKAERFSRLDKNGNGALSLDEFDMGRSGDLFERFDDNKDGAISKDEVEDMKGRFRKGFRKRD